MGRIVEHAISTLVSLVSAINDISEAESHHLNELLCIMIAPTIQLFNDSPTQSTPIDQFVPSFDKYLAIVNILNMSLVAIVERWESGDFKRLFTEQEMRHWMCALFSDTPLRATNLRRIVA
jgi:hypothetical protein